ncbi:fumarylacetoacetate hydrolase family protein [Phyllobacterium endophyticum]|uniref:5-carboxymethyl-2-hydroxymuconate isomerase n=1 Tax=Phyllobacterium endophyticum TaxID=1149773 RepID=A0A2P7AKC4_9HYPH|nr:fumarylacetoacetate hydrolase family protein [Phyllobacterium endophyticum]MBB3237085.1 2-keto-4-pentenoate hydratase/2-oxohepta-3-ene-1,7-dioic acid hydratase in catechol pathway [Phyllobacterium endophyticum]PSH54678.1 5-carboxymethyl-2-hydroxymuconate isomerase [Phyllobacterium endophyticum]TYR40555.1 fumarylacetoacetate hydrolase family protein [Phyllobacterium endophyticum]
MKWISFERDGKASWGRLDGEVVIDFSGNDAGIASLKQALACGFLKHNSHWEGSGWCMIDEVRLLPPIVDPDKIICVGLNYVEHRAETGRRAQSHPVLFTRFANTQVGHLGALERPLASEEFDYEGELAIVIGRAGRHIRRQKAFDHIAGYACYNDASVRDYQRHTHQFTPGKNFVATGGFGPWMMSADAVGDIVNAAIRTRLNGQIVQDAHIADMIFDIPSLIEYCSTFTRLEPGDIIATGTPGGVGSRRDPQLWLKHGDTVEIEIEGIGLLQNSVTDERAGPADSLVDQ